MKYPEYKSINYAEVADEILSFWQTQAIFEKSITVREGKPTFTFYEGPPSANGAPGIHHVMARTIKDIFCRYKTLQGFQVHRKGGWDTHGLPIELQVEKELGITKEDIGKSISVADYNKKCRETVMRFTNQWNSLTEKMGYWVDLENPYVTYKNEYIESIWHLLKKLYDKNLLYKGYTIQPYSPAAGTGLSSHELNQPGCYRDVKDTSMTAQFKVEKSAKSQPLFDATQDTNAEVFILAWTTTPWTLPSNAALTVGKNITYALVKTFNPYTYLPVYVLLAQDLIGKYFSDKGKDGDFEGFASSDKKTLPWKVVYTCQGADLEGITYEQLLPYVQPEKPAFRVIIGDFVTTEDGTGVVHTAPTFGADDFRVAQQNDIPAILVKDEAGKEMPLVDRRGRFVKEVTDFAGEFVKEAYLSEEEKEIERQKQGRDKYLSVDERIAILLKTKNRAFQVQRYDHSYPHCWRTDKPVLYYPLDSWFIRTTALKDKLVELNQTINWKPESTGTGRFGNWLENLVDWNLSRSRYWGTPLPIWRSEQGEELCIGSMQELVDYATKAVESGVLSDEQSASNKAFIQSFGTEEFDLHRPYVDDVFLVSDSQEVMTRETDLIDVWFDSGAMPYAQWHYPFENSDTFEKSYPADFISEGVDQTRGWFFTLHAIAGLLFDSVAFKNVVSTGLVLDKNGNKMSKRLGNAIDPFETLKTYGADPTRWYMITNAQPWDNLRFDLAGITEVRNKFFGTLTNTYNFFALYANLDNFVPTGKIDPAHATELDKWILSKLQTLILEVGQSYESYEPTKAGRAIQEFVTDQLSNWYVRLCRRRFWKGEYEQDKISAYQTLYECLETVLRLMAPVSPFFSDAIFTELNKVSGRFATASVHHVDFPVADEALIDAALEERMQLAQDASSLVLSLRKKVNIKVRQPLQKILIPVLSAGMKEQFSKVEDIIMSEVNVKEIEYLTADNTFIKKKIKPNFIALGKKLGSKMKPVSAALTQFTQENISQFERETVYNLLIDNETVTLYLTDVEIVSEDVPGWMVTNKGAVTVALDVTISPELLNEGNARELVNRIQKIRKESGFELTDRITVLVSDNENLRPSITQFKSYICAEILADDLDFSPALMDGTEVEINDIPIKVQVLKKGG